MVAGGVSSFGIRGIDPAESLDPNDPQAFVTGLRFMDSSSVSVQMTPISAAVPEPGSLTRVRIGALSMAGFAWRRRKSKLAAAKA